MKTVTIGRNHANNVVINDPLVRRNQCQIIRDDYGNFRLIDFGTSADTFVNDKKVTGEISLNLNDVIRIDNTTLPWQSYFRTDSLPKRQYDESNKQNWGLPSAIGTILLIAFALIRLGIRSSNNNHSHYNNPHNNYKNTITYYDPIKIISKNLHTASLDTIHPWNDEHISFTIPNSMKKTITDSTMLDMEEEYMNINVLYADVFRVGILRISTSDIKANNINDLQSFVAYFQKDSLMNEVTYTADTSGIKCFADKKGYSSLYYYQEVSDAWGKNAYISDNDYYYILFAWTHPDYKHIFNDLINRCISSFNIEK
ncbi:MAG: FHA domain-containing protein [Prevotellaceae bacterium]|jgi:hypothetical protein|nr:FHA domain-containing protein [Prevotellaceae bacterium]